MQFIRIYTIFHRIGGVMVSLLTLSVVDRGFQPWPGETKDYKTCCFTAKHVPLKCNNKYGFGQNQDNESEWGDMSYSGQLFQRASTITTKLSVLIWYKANISTISSTLPSSCHDIYKNNCFDFWCSTPLSEIFQLFHGDHFQWQKKPEYPERTTDHGQATGQPYHLRLRVESTLFCNFQCRERTHAALVIGLNELLGNPTVPISLSYLGPLFNGC